MKEKINYYYGMDIIDIQQNKENYYFKFNNNNYILVLYKRSIKEINDIVNCVNDIIHNNMYCHFIVLNIYKEPLTYLDNAYYILLKIDKIKEELDIFDITNYSNQHILSSNYSRLYRNNWSKLWSDKVDYFEYQYNELGTEKKEIASSLYYYIGLAENAIFYVNVINKRFDLTKEKIVLSHKRIYFPNYELNYYNPLSFIFDLDIRDIAEYLKNMYFNSDEDVFVELSTYLKINKLSECSYNMLFARLLYPTYYFDKYESIMNDNADLDILLPIVNKQKEYEEFLKKAYLEISKYANIEKIEWIIN